MLFRCKFKHLIPQFPATNDREISPVIRERNLSKQADGRGAACIPRVATISDGEWITASGDESTTARTASSLRHASCAHRPDWVIP
jgi:hypothetical protein